LRLTLLGIVALLASGCAQCEAAPTAEAEKAPEAVAPVLETPSAIAPERPESRTKRRKPVKSDEHPPGTTGAEIIAKSARNSHPALRALRVAARKLLVADQTVVSNQLSYQQAVDRTRREIKDLDLARLMPAEAVTAEALRPAVEAIVRQSSLTLVDLRIGSPSARRAVPETHPGPGPYGYHPDQLVAQQPLSITIAAADDAQAAVLFSRLKTLPGPLLDISTIRDSPGGERLIFAGVIPTLREVKPPVQIVRTPSLSELARNSGVEIPSGDYPTDDIQAVLDEHSTLHTELSKSMKLLAHTHLLGLQLRFGRQRLEANAKRSFPAPIGRQGPDLQTAP
jgi:hypothetical protein